MRRMGGSQLLSVGGTFLLMVRAEARRGDHGMLCQLVLRRGGQG